jgi:hypothetical protein
LNGLGSHPGEFYLGYWAMGETLTWLNLRGI